MVGDAVLREVIGTDLLGALAGADLGEARRSQVRTADRSEKVRTYNFPQDRITDHRINLSVSNLPRVLAGDLDRLIGELRTVDQTERLKNANLAEPVGSR